MTSQAGGLSTGLSRESVAVARSMNHGFQEVMARIADAVRAALSAEGRIDVEIAREENGFTFSVGVRVVTLSELPEIAGRIGVSGGHGFVTPVDASRQFDEVAIAASASVIIARLNDPYIWM